MKNLKEKGIANIDYVVASLVFMAGSVAVLALYYNIYVSMAKLKVEETAIGYVTEICEMIDLVNYEYVCTPESVNDIIQDLKDLNNGTEGMGDIDINCVSIDHYNNYAPGDDRDVVMRININVNYSIDGNEREYTISKVKVKE